MSNDELPIQQLGSPKNIDKTQYLDPIFDILEPQTKNKFADAYSSIHDNIEFVNSNLQNHFKNQEDQLIEYYKTEMYKASKELKYLKENLNEDQLRKQFQAKKEELQKEKEMYQNESIEFSKKCTQFKENLKNIQSLSEDIESEINFLDEQIIFADQNNTRLKKQIEKIKEQIFLLDPSYDVKEDYEFWQIIPQKLKDQTMKKQSLNQSKNLANNSISISHQKFNKQNSYASQYQCPYSSKLIKNLAISQRNNKDINQVKVEIDKQRELNEKLQKLMDQDAFKPSEFEIYFQQSIDSMSKKIKEKKVQLPSLNKTNLSSIQETSFQSKINDQNDTTAVSSYHEDDFNDYEKRLIFEDFLSRVEVKKFIYDKLQAGDKDN